MFLWINIQAAFDSASNRNMLHAVVSFYYFNVQQVYAACGSFSDRKFICIEYVLFHCSLRLKNPSRGRPVPSLIARKQRFFKRHAEAHFLPICSETVLLCDLAELSHVGNQRLPRDLITILLYALFLCV